MKKIFAIAVALIASVTMFAQNEVGTFTIAPKAGINVCSLTHKHDPHSQTRILPAFGGEVGYQMTNKIALTLGVMYSQQGCNEKGTDDEVKIDHLSMPILFNYYVCKNFALKTGIQPAIVTYYQGGDDVYEHFYEKYDLCIPLGASYEYKNFILDARYNYGLIRVNKRFDAECHKSHNSVLQVTLGYKFKL